MYYISTVFLIVYVLAISSRDHHDPFKSDILAWQIKSRFFVLNMAIQTEVFVKSRTMISSNSDQTENHLQK